MRLDKVSIDGFKNLRGLELDFDERQLTTVLIGQNGAGKSNLIEAIAQVFRWVDLRRNEPRFRYRVTYRIQPLGPAVPNPPSVCLSNFPGEPAIRVNGQEVKRTEFEKRKADWFPDLVFGYYSGGSRRLEALFDSHQRRYYDDIKLEDDGATVAVVTDLKGFYPSIRRDRVMKELRSRLRSQSQGNGLEPDAVENFYLQLFDVGGGGLPIGPASAHVLGHLALTEVDRDLTSAYGAGYFRYVDDILVVCDSADAEATKKRIADCVNSQGYVLNTDKSVVMSAEEWSSSVLRLDVAGSDDFRRYTQDLAAYLALHPDRASELGALLSDAGMSIPIQRLTALASYSRFRYFLGRRKAPGGLPHALAVVFAKNADFVERAVRLKRDYERSLDGLLQDRSAEGPELRRWHVQRIRRVVNTLFYLRRFSEWKSNSGVFEAVPELVEQRSLAIALATGTVNPILPFFTRGPAAFSELWSEHGEGTAAVDASASLTTAALDSLATLSLTGTVAPEAVVVAGEGERVRLLQVVKSRESLVRSNPDLSYEDEFEALGLGVTHEAMSKLARTRYAVSEGATLDALSLLSSEYRS